MTLLLAFGIGFVTGLRSMTGLAALALTRGGVWAVIMSVAAVGEYVVDALPNVPSRTRFPSIIVRPVAGAIAGWFIGAWHGKSPEAAAVFGVVGAVAGTFGGHAARLAAIKAIGAIPAAIAEDIVAIALAALVVTR